MVATLRSAPQVTHCRNCPNARQIEGDRYSCSHFNQVTRAHWPATDDCYWALEDKQACAQAELDRYLQEQAEAVAPPHRLIQADDVGFVQKVVVSGPRTAGYIYSGLGARGWSANHIDRRFPDALIAARSVAIHYARRQKLRIDEDTLSAAIRQTYGVDIWPRDIGTWKEQERGVEWLVPVNESAQPYRIDIDQLEAANQEVAAIEADIARF